jgi:hypothetical protein
VGASQGRSDEVQRHLLARHTRKHCCSWVQNTAVFDASQPNSTRLCLLRTTTVASYSSMLKVCWACLLPVYRYAAW